ncbi:Protein O-GlcNAcase [BD1-7 clade bacterium]|uniref:Protein O-GlcNAcase n=1 Tax=BD1-7 clade bacterium TaxID=2029982 RepID=A0A5S9QVQ7_9GAMM|nr:Protein O-GlcNAcase [BD1-7 clade bacterium]CAA0122588.1 Protein O-GlcNAcase [BD1-7 clade bacterium]
MHAGVIEGFYGRSWTHEERLEQIRFLAEHGFDSYWYAPKACRKLRADWAQLFDQDELTRLQELSRACRNAGIAFGVGFSPLGLHDQWPLNKTAETHLLAKLAQLHSIGIDEVGLLFDDMRGDKPNLASLQLAMVEYLRCSIDVKRWVFCPTYYSFDPILSEVFGCKPPGYLREIGQGLHSSVDVFWTGEKVISESYSRAHLEQMAEIFQRKPVLWDNSRVNDGRKTSPFIPLKSMCELASIMPYVNGLMINPMNPPALARLVLETFKLDGAAEERLKVVLNNQGRALSDALQCYLRQMTEVGLERLDDDERQAMRSCFANINHPAAREVLDWLGGCYRFDSACLT